MFDKAEKEEIERRKRDEEERPIGGKRRRTTEANNGNVQQNEQEEMFPADPAFSAAANFTMPKLVPQTRTRTNQSSTSDNPSHTT